MAGSLSLRHLVGQLLIMGFDGAEFSPLQKCMLRSLQPGGMILFARNIVTPGQTHALNAAARKQIQLPLFHCVDMEGGTVDRLKLVVSPASSAADVAATLDKKLFEKHGKLIGDEARRLGFNLDFAPVLDLDLAPSRGVLTSRTAAGDPKKVVAYARRFLDGLESAGVLGCGKHFPGLGEASLDSHHDLPSIGKTLKRMWDEDLYPYRALHKRLPFVMVAHAAYPVITGDSLPASLSPLWIKEVLRRKIGFDGIVVSDDLEMGGVLARATIEEVAVATIAAGADIFMVCHKEELVWRAYEAVLREAERSRKFRDRVNRSAERILRFKKKTKAVRDFPPAPGKSAIERLKQQMQAFREKVAQAQSRKNAQGRTGVSA